MHEIELPYPPRTMTKRSGLGKLISDARLAANLTQRELAEKLRVDASTISLWETNKTRPNEDTLLQLSEHIDIDLNQAEPYCNDQLKVATPVPSPAPPPTSVVRLVSIRLSELDAAIEEAQRRVDELRVERTELAVFLESNSPPNSDIV